MPRGEHLTRNIFFIKHPFVLRRGRAAGRGREAVLFSSSEVLQNQKVSYSGGEMEKVSPLPQRQNITRGLRQAGRQAGRQRRRPLLKAKKISALAAKASGMNFG